MFSSIPIILKLLTNRNIALIYSVIICQQNTKDCARSGSFQHKLQHRCFHLWCLPGFLTTLLNLTMVKRSSLLGQGQKTVGPISQHFHLISVFFFLDIKEPTPLFKKSREHRPWWGGQPLLGWVGFLWSDLNIGVTSWSSLRCHNGYP